VKISFSATNPCHVYDMARALHPHGALGHYYSGYPGWKLAPPAGFPLVARSARTLVTYGCLRLPASLRPANHRLFRWQDDGFDRAVGRALRETHGDFVHALPGQALHTFEAARARGARTVLNHASGPVRLQLAQVAAEYARAGLQQSAHHGYDAAYFARADREYELADFHCVGSTLVRDQLASVGVAAEKIWVVPYGANPAVFQRANLPRHPHRIVFAGQLTLRKGLRILFDAVTALRATQPVELALYGPVAADFVPELARFRDAPWVRVHGPVAQPVLARAFQEAAVLALPSWEEAFGLVVPQALNCGLPCIVSDRVGARDLIQPRRNGAIFPVGDASALAREIQWWLEHPAAFKDELHSWEQPADRLLALSRQTAPA
jgi:glycosyltransferase involved in cell wall biosynthesis